jgi:hypothetical protein
MRQAGTEREEAALYLPTDGGVVATTRCQGGWDPGAQHGGPVQGLLTRCVEQVPTLAPMQVSRLTFDLLRPVPLGPLRTATRIVREGKRIQVVEAVVHDGELELASCRALRLREEDLTGHPGLPTSTPGTAPEPLPPPDACDDVTVDRPDQPGFLDGIRLRRGARGEPFAGVPFYWVALAVPLVAGEETSPLCRLAVAGDFTNSIGVEVDSTTVSTINPDVNVHVARPPDGEWVAVVGETQVDTTRGVGQSSATLRDRSGVVAHASACQLVQRR